MAEDEDSISCKMSLSTDDKVRTPAFPLQTQSSVPNIPAGELRRGSPTPARTRILKDDIRVHRRYNSFSGGIDAHIVSLKEENSISLLEIATNLLKNAPVALCGGQYLNEDELILLPPQKDSESPPKSDAVLTSEQFLQRSSPHFRGQHCYYYDVHDSEEDMSIPEDEAYSSAPSTYRSSTSCDTSEYDQFSSSRSCIFSHSRNSSLASNHLVPLPTGMSEPAPVMTHGRKPSSSSIQSSPGPLPCHPLECAVTSTHSKDASIGSQVTLKGVDTTLSGDGGEGTSSGGETDGTKQTTEQTKKSKKKSKVPKWEDSLLQRGIKSVEWIKKHSEDEQDPLVQVKISSKSKHVVHFNVKAGDVVMWQFATKKRDIAFGVVFESTQVVHEETPAQTESSTSDKVTSILPLLRVPSNSYVIEGSHTAPSDGLYVMGWDNAFSRFFSKELFYKITTKMSQTQKKMSSVSVCDVYPLPGPDAREVLSSQAGHTSPSQTTSTDICSQHDVKTTLQCLDPADHYHHHQQQQQQQQRCSSSSSNHPILDL